MHSKCGSELAREEAFKSETIFRLKRISLEDTSRHAFQTTNPCAIAYSQARIGRLVRFGVGFYCGPVADESAIGFSDPDQIKGASAFQASLRIGMSATSLWWLYAGDFRVYRVPLTGSLTCVQPPPILFNDWIWRLHHKGAPP
jgi:hypothetical protein